MVTLVQHYFSQSAKRFPNKLAISCGDQEISYSEADRFSNGLANALRESGTNRGEFIPFFLDKGVNGILSILSILKADCAYVPIDTKSPGPRIVSILDACEAKTVIVDSASRQVLIAQIGKHHDLRLVEIDTLTDLNESEPTYDNLSIDLAYVLFTSGSTGVPKGVMIPHKAIIDYIDWCVDEYALTDNDVIANHAPLFFDNSTFDLYTAFKTGAELHLVDDAVNAIIPSLVKWIRNRNITMFFCVPSVLAMLLRSRRLKPDSFPKLRHLICAGEVLPPDTLRAWMDMYPHIQYTNMYGPTEITVDCTYYVIAESPASGEPSIPIGRARPNMELFVRLEDGGLSQESGARGELLVRGTSVAYGYLSAPEKTQEVFIQNPLNTLFHDPLYCTGDLVEIRGDGELVFLGRADDQIKHLGYRIELGEIEAALGSLDCVQENVVVYSKAEDSDHGEIGALLNLREDIPDSALIKQVASMLPNYMIPGLFVRTAEDFPRTPNGKYDRKAIRTKVFDIG